MAAVTAIRWNPPVRDLYLRLRARGRPAKAALVMGGHYLAGGINLGSAMTFGWIVGRHATGKG